MIQEINIEQIYPHPENPRKEIGDITELAESIKKNGIMQNLTVIPGHWDQEEWSEEGYTLLIGHRRHAASKAAGLTKLPCKIVEGMSRKEQIYTMLEENMQRNDLTIYEQAQGFQLMLDLGETEETISQKTGFSRSTVRHRLKLAELDQGLLKKKTEEGAYQLSLSALYELEAIKDEKTRNKVLREAHNNDNLIWRAQRAAKEEKRKEKTKQIFEILKELGVKKGPKGCEHERYSDKWETVKEFDPDKDIPKRINLPKDQELYYCTHWDVVRVFKKAEQKKKELSPEEIERKERDKNKKSIKAAMKKMDQERKEFIQNLISGHLKQEKYMIDAVWKVLMKMNTGLYTSYFLRFFTGKETYNCTEEEKAEAQKKVDDAGTLHQMLIAMHSAMENAGDIYDWQGKYDESVGEKLKMGYEILEQYGWSLSRDEDMDILNGSSDLYVKNDE